MAKQHPLDSLFQRFDVTMVECSKETGINYQHLSRIRNGQACGKASAVKISDWAKTWCNVEIEPSELVFWEA